MTQRESQGLERLVVRALSLSCALMFGGLNGLVVPTVLAHSGHGDEFVQNGPVDQVKVTPGQDELLGIRTAKPMVSADGQLSVPTVAIVEVDGQPLVFVRTSTTYDPVLIRTGAVVADLTVVLEGVSADEQIVVSGALSLFAESQKNNRSLTSEAQPATKNGEPTPPDGEEASPPWWMVPFVGGVAVVLVIAGAFGFPVRSGGRKAG